MFTTRPELRGTFGVVASTHWLASAVGMSILERGGNAFDAAVATAFTLQIVEPHLNGPGGEVPMLLWSKKNGRLEAVCGQGVTPAGATLAHYRALGLDLVPGTGLLAATVPGAFGAWLRVLRDYGTLKLADVLAPAIAYAGNGYPLVARIPAAIETVKDFFRQEWPSSAAIYLPGGDVPKAGRLFRNPSIAATYQRVLREAEAAGGDREAQIEAARAAWYRGFVAEAIDKFCRTEEVMDNSGRRHRGLLAGDDLARWEATLEAPLTYDYHGYTVAKCGPWTQGPIFLQQLALLRDIDLAGMDPLGGRFVHTVVEAAKLAFADREAWYADPNFVDVPMTALLSDAYAAQRRKLIAETASFELRPGSPDGRQPRLARLVRHAGGGPGLGEPTVGSGIGIGEPTMSRDGEALVLANGETRGDTCHVDVIDRWGNMISATPSGGWLQSSPTIPALGWPLGSRAQMFWLEEGLPSSLVPGTRPRTTLSPGLVLKDGEPWLAYGTPGGDQQEQWALHAFIRHVDRGLDLQAAIDAPEWHTDHLISSFDPRGFVPRSLAVESRFGDEVIADLRRRGHDVTVTDAWSLGRVTAVKREGGQIVAAANPRGMQGYAACR